MSDRHVLGQKGVGLNSFFSLGALQVNQELNIIQPFLALLYRTVLVRNPRLSILRVVSRFTSLWVGRSNLADWTTENSRYDTGTSFSSYHIIRRISLVR